jgi:uncharacterized protein
MAHFKRIALPLLLISSVVGVLHYYIYSIATQSMPSPPLWLALLLGFGAMLMPGSLLLSMSRYRKNFLPIIIAGYLWIGSFMIALFFTVIETAWSLFYLPQNSHWTLIATVIVSTYAIFNGLKRPTLVRHKMAGPEFLRGLKIAQVSDVHVGMPTINENYVQNIVEDVNSAAPDIFVVTGDLADGSYHEVAPQLAPLGLVKAQKFYVTGNHEYMRGGDWQGRMRELGFTVLHNSNVVFAERKLLIAGVPDRQVARGSRQIEYSPDNALKTSKNIEYKILLAHEPSSVYDIKNEKCDLLLAGHTHGGQIFPFGMFVRLVQPVVAGFKNVNNVLVFAHQGTGNWGPPMRWLTRKEIVVFEW